MSWLSQILKYLPVVIQGVVAVEAAIKSAPGKTKKQVVLDAIKAGATVGQTVDEKQVAGISALIDSVVSTLNTSGVFGHAAPPAPPTP